jgi:predicted acetyltransferase
MMATGGGHARLSGVDWKPHLADPDELRAAIDLEAIVFGVGPAATADFRAEVEAAIEPERTFVVDDAGTVVGTGSAYTYELAVPGGGALPFAGVTWVGVAPTHRRRGILRTIMAALADQALDRGEAIAGLTASEGLIYRRFGYGVAARFQTVRVDTARSAELVHHTLPGRMRLVDAAEAADALPEVWRRHWPRVPGEVSRTAGWWKAAALDPEYERGGASARYVVVHEDAAGAVDGYATYRMKQDWTTGVAGHQLSVDEIAASGEEVEAALLRFLLDVDLVRTLELYAPLDLPLRWRLVDSRALSVTGERDHLWLRPLDVARCLATRSYAGEGGLVVEVVDGDRPELGGRFRLEAGAGGAEAEAARTDAEADLTLAMPDLGAVLLGGVSWATLQRAGLVDEHRAGAIARADDLFRPERAPFCATGF